MGCRWRWWSGWATGADGFDKYASRTAKERGCWARGTRGVSEFALTSWRERRSSVRLDRMFRAGARADGGGDGLSVIVDYKTTTHGSAGIEEFLAGEKEKYGPQLEAYARMMRGETAGAGEDERACGVVLSDAAAAGVVATGISLNRLPSLARLNLGLGCCGGRRLREPRR